MVREAPPVTTSLTVYYVDTSTTNTEWFQITAPRSMA